MKSTPMMPAIFCRIIASVRNGAMMKLNTSANARTIAASVRPINGKIRYMVAPPDSSCPWF